MRLAALVIAIPVLCVPALCFAQSTPISPSVSSGISPAYPGAGNPYLGSTLSGSSSTLSISPLGTGMLDPLPRLGTDSSLIDHPPSVPSASAGASTSGKPSARDGLRDPVLLKDPLSPRYPARPLWYLP